METGDAKTLYKKRKQSVETVFGIIKSAIEFRRFHLRGITKAATEMDADHAGLQLQADTPPAGSLTNPKRPSDT